MDVLEHENERLLARNRLDQFAQRPEDLLPDGPGRAKAMGVFAFVASGGGAVGAVAGGFITAHFDWHWNFLINVPIGIAVLLGTRAYVASHKGVATGRIDFMAERLIARPLKPEEKKIVASGLNDLLAHYQASPKEAEALVAVGESKADPTLQPEQLAAWTMLVNQLMNLDEVLAGKGRRVVTVSGKSSITDAIRTMQAEKVGAVLVPDSGRCPVGIFTERDVVRMHADGDRDFDVLAVETRMTCSVVVGRRTLSRLRDERPAAWVW